MNIRFLSFCFFLSLLVSSFPLAANQCTDTFAGIFTHGVSSHFNNGRITFNSGTTLETYVHSTSSTYDASEYPKDRKLDFKKKTDNTSGSDPKSCGKEKCEISGSNTPGFTALGAFQRSSKNGKQTITTAETFVPQELPNLVVQNHGILTFSGGDGVYKIKNLTVNNGGTVHFSRGVYYINKLTLNKNAQIFHSGNGTAVLYVNTNTTLNDGSRMNNETNGRSSNFLLYVDNTVQFNGDARAQMFVYATNTVTLDGDSQVKGAINGKHVRLNSNAKVIWDIEATRELEGCDLDDISKPSDRVDLVAHWKANVCSINGTPGELVDVVKNYPAKSVDYASINPISKFCQSLLFDGIKSNVLIEPQDAFKIEDGTVSFWFKTFNLNQSRNSHHGGQGLWSKDSENVDEGGDHLTIWVKKNGSVEVRHQTDDSDENLVLKSDANIVSANKWYHVVYSWGSEASYLHVNGKDANGDDFFNTYKMEYASDDDLAESYSLAGNIEPIILGAGATRTGNEKSESDKLDDKLSGEMDEIRIYSGQMTESAVKELYKEEIADECEDCVVPEPVLISQYSSDVCDINGNGGTYIDSVRSHNGIYEGGVTLAAGKFCSASSFNGQTGDTSGSDGQNIRIHHVPDFLIPEGAISMWVYVPNLGFENKQEGSHNGQAIFSKDNQGYQPVAVEGIAETATSGRHLTIWALSDGGIKVRHQTENNNNNFEVFAPAGSITKNTWHHIMYTFGRNGKRLYVDGQIKGNRDGFSAGIETNGEPIILGASASSGNATDELSSWFKGRIDDVRIYGQAQPDDSYVAKVADEVVPCASCTPPMAHYKFEGSFNTAFRDSMGNHNGSPFPENDSQIVLSYGTEGTIGTSNGTCQFMSIPQNGDDDGNNDDDRLGSDDAGVQNRQAMDSGIEPDVIGTKGTISFWYQANQNWGEGGPRQLFDGSDESVPNSDYSKYFHGTMLNDGKIRFGMEDKDDDDARIDTNKSFTFTAGEWVHLAFVWDLTNAKNEKPNMRIFVNAEEQPFVHKNDTLDSPELDYQNSIFFGDNRTLLYHVGKSTGNSANGQFDDIRIYQIAQRAEEILNDKNTRMDCNFEVNRYFLEFPAEEAACAATEIKVKACEDANCQNLASGDQVVWIGYEYASGETVSVVDELALSGGEGSVSFTPERSGPGKFKITANRPIPSLPYDCNQPNCQINYTESKAELVYLVDGEPSTDAQVEVAQQLFSQTADGALVLRTPESCQLPGSFPVEVAIECIDPAVCSGNSFNIVGDGNNVTSVTPVNQLAPNSDMPESAFKQHSTGFNGAQLSLDNMLFNDAGEIKLHVKVSGQVVTQNIIVRPDHLKLSSSGHSTINNESVTTAGANFNMFLTAYGKSGGVLPNYQPGDLQFSMERITPEAVSGSTNLKVTNPADPQETINISDSSELSQFSANSFNTQPSFTSGVSDALVSVMPEVGRYAVDVRDANYLLKGESVVGVIQSQQALLDAADSNTPVEYDRYVFTRFIPDNFTLETTFDYSPACGIFTFRGDLIEASGDGTPHRLVFTAKNSLGQTTRYYDAGTASRDVQDIQGPFLAGEAIITSFNGTTSHSSQMLLSSMGRYTDSNNTAYSIWRIRNANDSAQFVNLESDNGTSWDQNYTVPANSDYIVASTYGSGNATHKLSRAGVHIQTKAADTKQYNLPDGVGGSFQFDLVSGLFGARQYTAVTQESGNQETTYNHVTFYEGATGFVNDVLSDGIFEYRFANDNVLFNKYFGTVQSTVNGIQTPVESAQPPIVNGTDEDQVSVRFNFATSLLKDLDNVPVDLNSITETTGKSVSIATINGIEYLVVDNLLDDIELRSGRIRLINSVTAELDTEVGIVSEYYVGDNNWEVNKLDSCTAYDSDNLAFMYVENTISGSPTLGNSGIFDNGIGDGADAMTIAIGGFTGENNSGVVDLGYDIPVDLNFMQYNWCGANSASTNHVNTADSPANSTQTELVSCRNPTGQYSFGQERGNDRVIHWREVLK